MRHLALVLATIGLAASAAPARSATTLILNESPAYLCYQAALRERDSDRGIDDCDVAIEHQALNRRDLASTLSNRGVLLGRSGDLKRALRDHNRAIRIAPEIGSLFINRANVYSRKRRFDLSLEDLNQAVAIADSVRHLAYYNRALLHQRLGNMAAARQDAERALLEAPDNLAYAEYLNNLKEPEPTVPSLQEQP